jgi:hypothetical protein
MVSRLEVGETADLDVSATKGAAHTGELDAALGKRRFGQDEPDSVAGL